MTDASDLLPVRRSITIRPQGRPNSSLVSAGYEDSESAAEARLDRELDIASADGYRLLQVESGRQ